MRFRWEETPMEGLFFFSNGRRHTPSPPPRIRMILPILSLTLVSFVISWALTFIVRRVAIRVGFTDKPGHRKIHSKPIALGGGIAIFLAFAMPMVLIVGAALLAPQVVA